MTLLKHIITCLYYLFIPRSYSQLGEDLVILNHLEWLGKNIKSPGFYVDIGAFHPLDGSNTYKLYRNGSSGVVIDVGSQKKFLFKLFRSRDTFIDAAVVPDTFSEKHILFNIDGYGSKNDSVAGYGVGEIQTTFVQKTQKVKALQISELMEFSFSSKYAKDASWSVINIDIEGLDEEVIKSINFDNYPFDVVCLEVFPHDIWDKVNEYLSSSVNSMMIEAGYSLQSVCGPTLIYLRKKSDYKQ